MYLEPENASTPSIVPRIESRRPINKSGVPSPIFSNQNMDGLEENELSEEERTNSDESEHESFSVDQSLTDECSDAEDNDNENERNELPSTAIRKPERSPPKYIPERNSNALIEPNRRLTAQLDHLLKPADAQTKIPNNETFNKYLIGLFVFVCVATLSWIFGEIKIANTSPITINTLKETFPQQEDSFWTYIESGVSEINKFEKPSVIILMYKDETVSATNKLLGSITKYASCALNDNCSVTPISLVGKELNTDETIKDYGVIIHRYKLPLEEKHIMVVRNIEEVFGTVAQAFHSFCDEYSPLVKKSLFLFTIKVDKYQGKPLQQVVELLENKWSDVEYDKLEPLITRVTSIVLPIK